MGTGILEISLANIEANHRALAAKVQGETGAVVKADAYGLGAARVAQALARTGVRSFFVAYAEEGVVVRDAVGPGPEIFVFSGHMEGDAPLLRAHDLVPMLSSVAQIRRHFRDAPRNPYGIQLDTGMNRLGLKMEDWSEVHADLVRGRPRLIASHLASADDPSSDQSARQLERFRAMTDGLDVRRSLAATGGTLLGEAYHFDLVRPGIGLYGGRPLADAAPVVRLSLPVIQTHRLQPGETVGYNATWTASRNTTIATISAGYADGLTRYLSNAGQVWHADRPCPIVGRVSMDLITVDVTDLDEAPDALTILSPRQTVDDLADAAGTIGYEILTSLGGRYNRRYVR